MSTKTFIAVGAAVAFAAPALADTLVVPVNYTHPASPGTGTVSVNFALPAVASIDSITVTMSHTWGGDIDMFVTGGSNGANFNLMDNNTVFTGSGQSGNFELGIADNDGSAGNVAPYVFYETGTGWSSILRDDLLGGYDGIQANAWTGGALAADTYTFTYDDQIGGDGGSIGEVIITYTVPAPGALALLGLAGMCGRRRRA